MGEASVLKYFPEATILRLQLYLGQKINFLIGLHKWQLYLHFYHWWVLLLNSNRYMLGMAVAVEKALLDSSVSGVYELGGPNVETFSELMKRMLGVIQRRRLMLNVPFFALELWDKLLTSLKLSLWAFPE